MNVGIVVGCSGYQDPRIADLKYAHEDANRIAGRFAAAVGVGPDNLVVLHDGMSDSRQQPTRANLLRELARLARSMDEAVDVLLFFFSGHGFHSTADGSDYLLLADATEEVLEQTSVPFGLVLELLRAVSAHHVLLFLDACRAAASGGKGVEPLTGHVPVADLHPTGMVSFASCEPGAFSYEADELGSGLFSAVLDDALSEIGRCVTVEELSRYLRTTVPALCRKTGKPVQIPHTRIEPLELKDLELVTPHLRNSWHSASLVGRELLRRNSFKPIGIPGSGDPVVAIDFGTTYSAIGLATADGGVEYVSGPDGRVLVPSVVSFTDNMDYLVGNRAVEAEIHRPERTVRNVKRQLGTGRLLRVGDQSLTPELVASLIIRSLRDDAAEAIGRPVRRCVVAYPANFSSRQKESLRQAFELAGVDIMRMIGEPNSAGMLPLFENESEHTCLIVDLGGGTVDVALIEIGDGVAEVRSVAGNNDLGGLDYDDAILGVVRGRLVSANSALVLSEQTMVELLREAERAKRLLSTRDEAVVVVRDLPTDHGLDDVELVVTRDDVRGAVGHLDAEVTRLVRAVLGGWDKGVWVPLRPESVDTVVFSGSGGRMFTVREAVQAAGIGGELVEKYQELGVVRGLVGQAAVLTGLDKDRLLLDLTHRAVGFRAEPAGLGRFRKSAASTTHTMEILLDHSVCIPTSRSYPKTFVGEPDEPLTLEFLERSRTDDSLLTIGTVRLPLPGAEVSVELTYDIDANGAVHIEVHDHTNKTAYMYYLVAWSGGSYGEERRIRLLTDGWRLHQPRYVVPGQITDDSGPDGATGETLATIDIDAELAGSPSPIAHAHLLTALDRPGEALSVLMPVLVERPGYAWRVPYELCMAGCAALAKLPSRYRQPGIRALVDRLTHTISLPAYDISQDSDLPVCLDRLSELGETTEIRDLKVKIRKIRVAKPQS